MEKLSYQNSGILTHSLPSFWINNLLWDFLSSLAASAGSMIFLFDSYSFSYYGDLPLLPLAMGFPVLDVHLFHLVWISVPSLHGLSFLLFGKQTNSSFLWKQMFVVGMLLFLLVFSKVSLLLRFKKCMCDILKNAS